MNKYVFWGIIGLSATVILISIAKKQKEKNLDIKDEKLKKEAGELIARIAQQDY